MEGIFGVPFIPVALGLSMLLFRPEWQERIKLGPRSAMISTLAILILIGISR